MPHMTTVVKAMEASVRLHCVGHCKIDSVFNKVDTNKTKFQ